MADGKLIFDTKVDTKGVEEGMTKVSTVAKGALAADVVKAAASAMGNLGKAAIEVGKNFETSMSQVAATMGITNEEIEAGSKDFDMLKAKAKEMGATTKYTASEAAEGLNILAMAGLSAEEACAGIGDVMALAGAGAMSLEQSATYVTGAVKGFNDEMENAGKYADIMAKGATMANTDVAGLGEALSRASSNATAYNQSVESTSVALLRLAEQNVTGAEAATAMSRVMADLYTPTDKAAKALKELGIATYDEQGNARDLNDVVDELNVALSGMSDEQKLAYENTIFTTFGMKGFQKMCVSSTETVNKFKKGIAEASGSAMQQFATQTNNLEGKLAILNSALEATGIAIYEVFEDTMKDSVDSATDAVDKLHDSIENGRLGDSLKRLAQAAGDFLDTAMEIGTVALPPIIDGLSFLVENMPLLIGSFVGYKAALAAQEIATLAATVAQEGLNAAMMANPAGLIAAGIGLAVGAVSQMVVNAKEAERELNEIADSTVKVTEKITSLTDKIHTSLEDYKGRDEYIRNIATELKTLNGLDKLDEQQKKRVKDITAKLNAEYSDLNLQIDEATGKLAEECQGWENLLEAKMQQQRYQSVADMMTEAMKEQSEAEYELWNNEQKLADIQQKRAAYQRELDQIHSGTHYVDEADLTRADQLYAKLNDLDKQEKILNDTHTELETKTGELSAETQKLSEYADTLTEAEKENAEAAEGVADANGEIVESADEVAEAIQKEQENLESLVESQVASFEKIQQASALSKEEVIKNLESNVEAMNNWAENMNTLAERGINDGLLQHLAQMGPEGALQVQQFVDMSGEELEKAGELWTQALSAETITNGLVDEYMNAGTQSAQAWIDGAWQTVQSGGSEVAQGMIDSITSAGGWNSLPTEVQNKLQAAAGTESIDMSEQGNQAADSFVNAPGWNSLPTEVQAKIKAASNAAQESGKEVGNATGKGTADGIKESTEKNVKPEAENQGKAATESTKEAVGTKNKETGNNLGSDLADGIDSSTKSKVNPAATDMGKSAVDSVDKAINKNTLVSIGTRVGEGLAEGIRSKIDDVKAAATELGKAAETSTSQQLKVNSPSKVFEEIGQYCVAGFNKGLNGGDMSLSLGDSIQASLAGLSAIDRTPQPVIIESHIHMDADAQRVFRMVSQENRRIYETTGQNQLDPK